MAENDYSFLIRASAPNLSSSFTISSDYCATAMCIEVLPSASFTFGEAP